MINYYYVPPENIENPPAIYCRVEESQKPIDVQILPVVKPNKPTSDDYKKAASSIKDIFVDGFQINDIATLMQLSLKYLDTFLHYRWNRQERGCFRDN